MEALGAVATIGTIVSGIKWCCRDFEDMRYAWRHGQKDLQDFSLKVQLFEKALSKVVELFESDPKHAKDIRKLGRHTWSRLEIFLKSYQELLPALKRSKRARARTRFKWFIEKKTADSLLCMLSHSEVSLNLWVSIDKVQSQDKLIKTLEEEIQRLKRRKESVHTLRGIVYVNILIYGLICLCY